MQNLKYFTWSIGFTVVGLVGGYLLGGWPAAFIVAVLAVLGLYPARGTNPTWGFAALFALSVLCVLLWRTGLRLCAHGRRRWSGRGAGRGGLDQRPPIELEGV